MALPTFSNEQVRVGFLKQALWGTAEAVGANFKQVSSENVDPTFDIKRRDGRQQRGLIAPHIDDLAFDENGAMPTLILAGDVRKTELAWWLWAVIQNVAEEVSTPFVKTFTAPDAFPDFDDDAGAFFTIARDLPPSASGQRFKDMVGRSLTLTWDAETDRLQFNLEMVGLGASTVGDTFGGTWAREAASFLTWGGTGAQALSVATIDFGGGAVNLPLMSFEMVISWDTVQGVGIEAGQFQTLALGQFKATQKIKIVKGVLSDTAHANWRSDTPVDTLIGTDATVDADGEFLIAGHGKITSVKNINDAILATEIEIELAENPGVDEMFTIEIADAQDIIP